MVGLTYATYLAETDYWNVPPDPTPYRAADEALLQCHARALAGLEWSLPGEAETKALSALLSRHEAQLTHY